MFVADVAVGKTHVTKKRKLPQVSSVLDYKNNVVTVVFDSRTVTQALIPSLDFLSVYSLTAWIHVVSLATAERVPSVRL
jgi:hypothetical protein